MLRLNKYTLLAALASPISCLAAAPPEGVAINNCAQAEAHQLDVKLASTVDQLTEVTPNLLALGPPASDRQMVVTAKDQTGRVVAKMVCTYDDGGRVVHLSPTPDMAPTSAP